MRNTTLGQVDQAQACLAAKSAACRVVRLQVHCCSRARPTTRGRRERLCSAAVPARRKVVQICLGCPGLRTMSE
jgi:hypothetical protein